MMCLITSEQGYAGNRAAKQKEAYVQRSRKIREIKHEIEQTLIHYLEENPGVDRKILADELTGPISNKIKFLRSLIKEQGRGLIWLENFTEYLGNKVLNCSPKSGNHCLFVRFLLLINATHFFRVIFESIMI